jgi:hypothetical protein
MLHHSWQRGCGAPAAPLRPYTWALADATPNSSHTLNITTPTALALGPIKESRNVQPLAPPKSRKSPPSTIRHLAALGLRTLWRTHFCRRPPVLPTVVCLGRWRSQTHFDGAASNE